MESRYQQILRFPCKTRLHAHVRALSPNICFTTCNQNSLDSGQKVERFNNGEGIREKWKNEPSVLYLRQQIKHPRESMGGWWRQRKRQRPEKHEKEGKVTKRYIYIYIKNRSRVDCQRRSDFGRWSCSINIEFDGNWPITGSMLREIYLYEDRHPVNCHDSMSRFEQCVRTFLISIFFRERFLILILIGFDFYNQQNSSSQLNNLKQI